MSATWSHASPAAERKAIIAPEQWLVPADGENRCLMKEMAYAKATSRTQDASRAESRGILW